jgi:hypothetical protein
VTDAAPETREEWNAEFDRHTAAQTKAIVEALGVKQAT